MTVEQILPIIIPGALIQFSIQIYYIKHCWENSVLPKKQKAWWIAAIAIFNIPAAAAYLIITREKKPLEIQDVDYKRTNVNISHAVSILLYLLYMIFSITILFNNSGESDLFLLGILLSLGFVLIFLSWFANEKKLKYLHYILPVISLTVASYINFIDDYSITTLLVLVIAANIINNHRLKASKIYVIVGFVLFIGFETAGIYKNNVTIAPDELVGIIYLNSAIYALVCAAFYLLKKQLLLNIRLQDLIEETNEKSKALEEMTAISERNKIAGEIHDTVGHTLTTAIISLDAAFGNIGTDDKKAKEKLIVARNQIKKGMDDIRYSVRAIKHGTDNEVFGIIYTNMVKELEKNAGIKINVIIESEKNLIPIHRNIIYRVTKECVTNSLKHSGCTEADILMSESGGILNFTFSDDGKGVESFKEGFGLANIREMTEAIGGKAVFSSSPGDGFTVNLRIPTGREATND